MLIKSPGFRISPTEVEEILFQNTMVRHAAVIGVPDEMPGQQIKAFVVRNDDSLYRESLIAFCSQRLAPYMVPRSIEFLEQSPQTTTGKVDYCFA